MNASTAPGRLRDFVAAVAAHFDDLPERERAELLDDLEAHLLELSAEGDADLEAELASPAAYAEELRRSAGLPDRRATVGDRLVRVLTWPRERPAVKAVVAFLPQLRPAWWVVRAWVAVTVLAFMIGGGNLWAHVPVPGAHPAGLLLLAAAVVVSVRLGQGGRDRTRVGTVADGTLGLAATVLALSLLTTSPVTYVPLYHDEPYSWGPSVLRHPDGEPITNLHLFDLEGNPLRDVLVFDGLGRPVEVGDLEAAGFGDLDASLRRDRLGNPVRNLYPMEQYLVEPGEDGETRRPRPVPEVRIPALGSGAGQPVVPDEAEPAAGGDGQPEVEGVPGRR